MTEYVEYPMATGDDDQGNAAMDSTLHVCSCVCNLYTARILSLNCRCLGQPEVVRELCSLCELHHHELVCFWKHISSLIEWMVC